MLGQTLNVDKRDHPPGEHGIRTSLEEVAKKVGEGGRHPTVVAWMRECLNRARDTEGIACNTDRQRAEVLLRAVQKKLWIPDPVATEFMAGAHLLACDRSTPDELCFISGDCDELVVLLGACFLAANLHCMVVGHAYDRDQNIQHVILRVRVRRQGGTGPINSGGDGYEWLYADPSPPHKPLGQCVRFTRERWLSVPNVKVICDAQSCETQHVDPDREGFAEQGFYVGVSGVHEQTIFQWLGSSTFEWLAAPGVLGQEKSAEDQVIEGCASLVTESDLTTGEGREKAAGDATRCAADALCSFYSEGAIPPGVCGSIIGPVADAVIGFVSDLFSSHPVIDCSLESSFDPCSPCKLLAWRATCNRSPLGFNPMVLPGFRQPVPAECASSPNFPPACKAWREGAAERGRVEIVVAANQALALQYSNLYGDALDGIVRKFGGTRSAPSSESLAKIRQLESATGRFNPSGADVTKTESGLVIGRALGTVAPAYQQVTGETLQSQYIPTGGAPARRRGGPGIVPVAAGLGVLGLIAWTLLR